MQQQALFDDRFLDQYTGKKLLRDPITAIVELIANSWDAGSTQVHMNWPTKDDESIIIQDNGEGMTENEFTKRWLTFSYNRLAEQGDTVQIIGHSELPFRKVFGRNGIGRFAGFCFASSYHVSTAKEGKQVIYEVSKSSEGHPIKLKKITQKKVDFFGTSIEISCDSPILSPEKIRSEIGMRFLTDPNFQVFVNNTKVDFDDLPKDGTETFWVEIPDSLERIKLILIDAKKTDRTTKQHGIAWQVNGRLVGECSWQGSGHESFLDGRRIEAKRYTFIIFADSLNNSEIIKEDWTGFRTEHPFFQQVQKAIQTKIREILLELTRERREETFSNIRSANIEKVREMLPISRCKWEAFVKQAQEECPSIAERDLEALSGVLANLELSNSRYKLIHKLHALLPGQFDDLHDIFTVWNIDAAKTVLDELQWRIKLIDELHRKTADVTTLEVQELQPLFERGLWIFGPEFESIEFTSNQGMTTVIQKLFKSQTTGSRNRPDFAILPDGSVGLYSCPEFDEAHAEIGIARLVVVELKKPAIKINDEQKTQCWKYVKELISKGFLSERTKVDCYVLGSSIDEAEVGETTHNNDRVKIRPLLFNTILARAKSRVHKLYEKVKSAPFLQEQDIIDFLEFDESGNDSQKLLVLNKEDLVGQ
jgi:hypothetical protein